MLPQRRDELLVGVAARLHLVWNGRPMHSNRHFFGQPRKIRGVHEVQLLAIDLGKQFFHIHGITDDGEVMSKKVNRSKLEATEPLAKLSS